ncbi:hypothetical protein FIBSPDRAFT_406973 [Athelia psychrophila]|uniref:Uncharacterized protein n=1 Tax=Athelia psychrophila TaxID=1759441 RepID=A0A166N9B1_9AGAM|nr:hypothetical protein FIBSPDRAFT_406973 [Fibularhizoctonia sp. CBS 109695]
MHHLDPDPVWHTRGQPALPSFVPGLSPPRDIPASGIGHRPSPVAEQRTVDSGHRTVHEPYTFSNPMIRECASAHSDIASAPHPHMSVSFDTGHTACACTREWRTCDFIQMSAPAPHPTNGAPSAAHLHSPFQACRGAPETERQGTEKQRNRGIEASRQHTGNTPSLRLSLPVRSQVCLQSRQLPACSLHFEHICRSAFETEASRQRTLITSSPPGPRFQSEARYVCSNTCYQVFLQTHPNLNLRFEAFRLMIHASGFRTHVHHW